MITSKTRSILRGKANGLAPCFQIGKGGIEGNVLSELSDALENRELIKVSVLNNCDMSAKELINVIAEKLCAEAISAVGNKMVLYRYSKKEGIKHLEF